MAPGSKRKRSERQFSHDDGAGRPSPHRPEGLNLAQQNQHQSARGGNRGGRRSSRQSNHAPSSPGPSGHGGPATPRRGQSPAAQTPNGQQRGTLAAEQSRPATPAQRPATPLQQPQQDNTPKAPPAPYAYEYLTDEIVDSWQEKGRQSTLDAAKGDNGMAASVIVQELVRASLDGRIEASQAGSLVKDLIADQPDADIQSLLMDNISLLDDSDHKNPALGSLVAATGIDAEVLRQELDVPLVISLGLARSTFDRMRARKTTNMLYRQANFNLLREETEGYAKLLTDYYNAATESSSNEDAEMAKAAFHRIMALVGAFDLDVGRVLDITLDISASLLVKSFRFFVKFYRCSSWWPQRDDLDNVKWEDQGFGSLPGWAVPGSEKWVTSDEDRAELAVLRQTRDLAFWQRVKEVGMHAFFELGARKITDYDAALPILETEMQPQYDNRGNEISANQRKRISENRKYMKETRMLPPPGNPEAAQLLGFKLRFYASPARDAQDVLPDNLIYLAALLIKIGFISLRDLYPHLYPADEGMDSERERLEKEKAEKERKERPGGGMNALLAAGALADDTAPAVRGLRSDAAKSGGNSPKPDKKEEEAKEELPPPTNQKLILLKALLAIGALPDALFILGRFPWLIDVDTTLPPYLHRIANLMLSKVGDEARPLQDRHGLQDTKRQLANLTPNADGLLSTSSRPKTRTRRWLGLDEPDEGEGVRQLHYYQDWDDNIPICQTLDDVFLLCNTFLGYLGVKIGQDALLLSRLLRLAKQSLAADECESNRTRWLELMKRLLVPALSLSKHNPALTQDVWELLNFFPITTRYNIYSEWFTGKTSRTPDMRSALDRNRAEVKDVLRRITNESGKKQSRALAKVSFASPAIVMTTFINQLESYSNMIPGLVESVRYFSELAFDVLTYCLINALSGQGRNRMQGDGMLTSPWLQALSQFVASLFTRYNLVNPSPVLQYVASELRNCDSTDLELIDQVLAEMAGIKSDMNFNETQVLGMTGGELLQSQIVQQLSDQRHSRGSSAKRLMKALSDPGLVGQLLISIAQERQMYPHHEGTQKMPLKVLGNNLDKIQQVFAQYLDVLRTNLTVSEFEASVPDVISLIGDFGLEPGTAFTICRSVILHRMAEVDAAKKEHKLEGKTCSKSVDKTQDSGDAEMKDAETAMKETDLKVESQTTAEATESAAKDDEDDNAEPPVAGEDTQMDGAGETGQVKEEVTPAPPTTTQTNGQAYPWHPALEPIIERLPAVTGDLAPSVSIPFYVTFWSLAPQDIFVPMDVYTAEMDKLQAQAKAVGSDRSDMSTTGLKNRERKKRDIMETADKLRAEMNERISGFRGYSQVKMWLNTQKKHWFPIIASKPEKEARHDALLQYCFLPRAMMSSLDAHYCIQIIKTMQNNATPGYGVMLLLGRLFQEPRLAALFSQCTSREAEHLGRFLFEILKLLAHWHSSQQTYEKEALGSQRQYHGFALTTDANGAPSKLMDYEEFRRLVTNWHSALQRALKTCFSSGDSMQVRNSIILLKTVVPVFPALVHHGRGLSDIVKDLSENEPRADLKLAALSLRGPLKAREDAWVQPQSFRINATDPVRSSSKGPSAKPATPQSDASTPKLNAAAPAFKPSAVTKLANDEPRKVSVAGTEDGEISDDKPSEKPSEKQDVKMEDAQPAQDEKKARDAKDDSTARPDQASSQPSQKPAQKLTNGESVSATADSKETAQKEAPATNGSLRKDQDRPASSQPGSRPGSTLPPRPEGGPPARPLPTPPAGNRNFRGRDTEQYGRLERPGDARSTPSRGASPGYRGRGRTPERDPRDPYGPPSRGYRDERAQPRPPPDSRFPRDDPRNGSRRETMPHPGPPSRLPSDSRSRANAPMGPPSGQSPHPDRLNQIRSDAGTPGQQPESSISPSTAQPSPSANDTAINPERARRMAESPRDAGDRRRERDSRLEERSAPSFPLRSDSRANGRHESFDSSREQPPRAEQAGDQAPTGPRASRSGPRELFEPNQPRGAGDAGRGGRFGRGDMGPPVQPESSYGRLNGPAPDTPSGPRPPNGPAGRGGRNFSGQGSRMGSREDPTAPSPSSAHPSASPAGPRGSQTPREPLSRRESGMNGDRQNPASQPSTPAGDGGSMLGMHPSRAQQFGPSPIQTNVPTGNGPRATDSPTNMPPSGPRSSNRPPLGTPTGPSPTTATPSGPATDRQRKSDRQRANINATLNANSVSGPAGQGTQFRGAARTPSGSGPSQDFVPPATQPMDAPPRRDVAPRPDGPPSRAEPRADLFQRSEDRDGGRHRRYEEERGPPRHRSSRNPSRERRPDDGRALPPAVDDAREKRGAPRGDERRLRDERIARDAPRERRSGRDEDLQARRPPPDMAGQYGAAPPPEWERGQRRDPADDGRQSGPRGGRGEDLRSSRREEERRGGPGPREEFPDGRKRRHDEGAPPPFDPSKRRRSGR